MKLGDTVGALAEPQPEDGHVVTRRVAAVVGLGTEGHDGIQRQPGIEVRELVLHEALVETVDSRRHGSVGGEDGSGAGQLDGSGKVMPIGQVLADAFETEEPGMALVAVVDIGLGTTGDLAVAAQCPDTTDAKDDLLRETMLGAAAVEPVSDVAGLRVVVVAVGVEHQQRDAADGGHPDGGEDLPPGDLHADLLRVPGGIQQAGHGHFVGGQHRVAFLLPPGGVQPLPEIPEPVEQADADQRQPEIGCRLQVVAGEDSQPSRVLGQHLADPELGREVSDARRGVLVVSCVALEPQVGGEIVGQIIMKKLHVAGEDLVRGKLLHSLRTHRGQQLDGILTHLLPELRVDGPEKIPGLLVPRPAKILRQRIELRDAFGQHRMNGESSECTHEHKLH